jgi:hypothetical protein
MGYPVQPVSRTLSLARRDRPVLGATLNRSESTCLLMTQGFSPLGVPNRRSQRTLENKSFFAASVPTRTEGDNHPILQPVRTNRWAHEGCIVEQEKRARHPA